MEGNVTAMNHGAATSVLLLPLIVHAKLTDLWAMPDNKCVSPVKIVQISQKAKNKK